MSALTSIAWFRPLDQRKQHDPIPDDQPGQDGKNPASDVALPVGIPAKRKEAIVLRMTDLSCMLYFAVPGLTLSMSILTCVFVYTISTPCYGVRLLPVHSRHHFHATMSQTRTDLDIP